MPYIIGAIGSFLAFIGSKITAFALKIARFFVLVSVNFAVVVVFFFYIRAVISSIWWVYFQANELLKLLSIFDINTILGLGFAFLQSIGIWDGFVDAFKILSTGFISIFVIVLSKVLLKALLYFRNTVFMLIVSLK